MRVASGQRVEALTGDPQAVVSALQRGERTMFDVVVRTHAAPLIRFVFGYLHDRAAAEDVVQDVFLHLWQQHETLVVHTTLPAYLYAAARSRALNVLRRTRLADAVDASAGSNVDTPAVCMGHGALSPDNALEIRNRDETIRQAIEALPPLYRRTLALRFTQGLSTREMTEALGVSPKTIETQITRGLRMLRERLRPSLEGIR